MKEQGKLLFFQAICKSLDGSYFLSPLLYCDAQRARDELGSSYVRLATELKAIEIEREEVNLPEGKVRRAK